jgi:DNA repair protein RecO (recombination protein O)
VLAGLAYMGDLIIEFSPPYQANEKLFRMLKACLESISEAPGDLQPILRYFEIWLLRLEGFFPDIRHCGECSRELSEAENILIGPDLTISCASCKHPLARALPKGLNAQLRATQKLSPRAFAQGARTVSAVTLGEMKKLTQQIIARVLEREPRTPVFLG